jgi:hypothetical protein
MEEVMKTFWRLLGLMVMGGVFYATVDVVYDALKLAFVLAFF